MIGTKKFALQALIITNGHNGFSNNFSSLGITIKAKKQKILVF